MPKPRKTLISVKSTPYYHCVSRCVRRAFLCGSDAITGHSYEHRRGWLESKILKLPSIFSIDVAAYAVMSNHYHVVLHINTARAEQWTDYEVVERWHQIFNGTMLSQKYLKNEEHLSKVELSVFKEVIAKWRSRLQDISWFMRVLNEGVAREANAEDDCTGRFWEGRFKSQALLDEAALIACMAYVDLNPVRGGIAKTAEKYDYTSIKRRCNKAKKCTTANQIKSQDKLLLPFIGSSKLNQSEGIQFALSDYLELVDCTSKVFRSSKQATRIKVESKVLSRLSIDSEQWQEMTSNFEDCFSSFVGHENSLRMVCKNLHYQRPPGLASCKSMFH